MEIILIRTLQFVMAITILVFLHECGHFIFSKLFGVRVNKFYVFFDWRFSLFSSYSNWWRRLRGKKPVERDENGEYIYDGTEYGIGWLPLGGYCQIEGMIDETQHDVAKLQAEPKPYEFRGKPAWQRLLIMVGGVLVNFLLALVIYAGVLYTWGEDYVRMADMTMGMKFNQDARALGFRDGDVLLGTDERPFREFTADVFRDLSTARVAHIVRDGHKMDLALPGDLNLLTMLKSDPVFARPFIPCDIDSVMAGTPAAKAGLRKGDKITALNGHAIDSWNEMTYQTGILADRLTAATTARDSLAVRRVTLVVQRAAATAPNGSKPLCSSRQRGITPALATTTDTLAVTLTPELQLGVLQSSLYTYYRPTHRSYGLLESIPAGARFGWNILEGYVSDMKYVFSADGAKSLGGFGTIASLFPGEWDWMLFWRMTAFLSIILAFMNFLPIPALDGGHILFLLYEIVTRRKPSDKFLLRAQYVGMTILFLLLIVANLNDVLRWVGIM